MGLWFSDALSALRFETGRCFCGDTRFKVLTCFNRGGAGGAGGAPRWCCVVAKVLGSVRYFGNFQ